MRLQPVSEQISTELKKIENARRPESAQKSKGTRPDRSDFSANAQRLSETKADADIVASHLQGQPDIREEKVADAREKIKNGYYDSPEFVDKLAAKLISDFGLGAAPGA
jgi:anti-sigma28 factor (negative regulator of flagellin synthesis)